MSKQTYKTNGQCKRFLNNYTTFALVRINPNLIDEINVRETIAHELAHAVNDIYKTSHNWRWFEICKEIYELVGLDSRRVSDTNDRQRKIIANIQFKMTEKGITYQNSAIYRNATIIHSQEVYTTRQLNRFKSLEDSNTIKIIKLIIND